MGSGRSSPYFVSGHLYCSGLLCPWTPESHRSLHWAPCTDPQPALGTEHRLPPNTFSSSPVLLPNPCPALEFFMGFYLVLTRLHGPGGPAPSYTSRSQAQDDKLACGSPASPRPPQPSPSRRVGVLGAPAHCRWAQALPQSLPALRTLKPRVLGVGQSNPLPYQPPGSPDPRTRIPASSHHIQGPPQGHSPQRVLSACCIPCPMGARGHGSHRRSPKGEIKYQSWR